MPKRINVLPFLFLAAPAFAQDSAPLSAVDWLRNSFDPTMQPAAPEAQGTGSGVSGNGTIAVQQAPADEPPVAESATTLTVTSGALGDMIPENAGILPQQITGFPLTIWHGSDPNVASNAIRNLRESNIQASIRLFEILLLAEASGTHTPDLDARVLLARIDALVERGSLFPAFALIESIDWPTSAIAQRYLDVALISDQENRACEHVFSLSELEISKDHEIFCHARLGQWTEAANTLQLATATGEMSEDDALLMALFLDPELAEEIDPPQKPHRPTPVQFRIYEALGLPYTTAQLPIAFANADLQSSAVWRQRIEAAERLSRHAAVSPAVLEAAYLERPASISGGIWERADAFNDFETALRMGDVARIRDEFPRIWREMLNNGTEVAFAQIFSNDLLKFHETLEDLAEYRKTMLISLDYQRFAEDTSPLSETEAALLAIADGKPFDAFQGSPLYAAALAGFDSTEIASRAQTMIDEDRIGEAVIYALAAIDAGAKGDTGQLTEGLRVLRVLGQEDASRQIALQLLVLDNRA